MYILSCMPEILELVLTGELILKSIVFLLLGILVCTISKLDLDAHSRSN